MNRGLCYWNIIYFKNRNRKKCSMSFQSCKKCWILGSGSGEKKWKWGNIFEEIEENWKEKMMRGKKMRKRRKKWRKNEEKTKNEESKETIRKNWGITGENGEISVKMRKMGRKKWGKLGKFLFLKLRSGEIFYFCAFFATLVIC